MYECNLIPNQGKEDNLTAGNYLYERLIRLKCKNKKKGKERALKGRKVIRGCNSREMRTS